MNDKQTFPAPKWLLTAATNIPVEFVIVVITSKEHEGNLFKCKNKLTGEGVVYNTLTTLAPDKAVAFSVSISPQQAYRLFADLSESGLSNGFDVAILPEAGRKKKLLVCDMDSTIVQTETLDDIAKQVGLGEQVSEITRRAMHGELDFRQALMERVSLLTNVEENVINEVIHSIRFNKGAEKLLVSARRHGIRSVLVSGGFEPIVKTIAEKLGFDRYVCNQLELVNGRLTGKVFDPVVDKETKLNVLLEECQQLGIKPELACSIGDGANDIPMLEAAGLGIGFQGKPLVKASTPYQINTTDLESVLYMMGINV